MYTFGTFLCYLYIAVCSSHIQHHHLWYISHYTLHACFGVNVSYSVCEKYSPKVGILILKHMVNLHFEKYSWYILLYLIETCTVCQTDH